MFPVSAAIINSLNSKKCGDSIRHEPFSSSSSSLKDPNLFLFKSNNNSNRTRSNGSSESLSTTDTGRTTILTAANHNMRGTTKSPVSSSPAFVAATPVDRNGLRKIGLFANNRLIPNQCCKPTTTTRAIFAILGLLCLLCSPNCVQGLGEITWAVNCGGGSHTDIQGIRYQADYQKTGISSDYGKNLMIQRIVPQDQILYQTERYHTSTFGYEIPIKEDGDYVMVLKFCEVWFTSSNQKVFDIVLNGEHTVVDELDIFAKVGRGVAHDEMLPFSIKNGKLKVNGETSQINGKVTVEFIKGEADNPKINAIYVMKGTLDDVPKLPSLPGAEPPQLEEEEEEEEEESPEAKSPSKSRRPSGPKAQDPYAADDTSTMLLPVFVAIGAFIPLLFCLCRL